MPDSITIKREFVGIQPPDSTQFPKGEELISLCPEGFRNQVKPFTSGKVTFWIKWGYFTLWNEVIAQHTAYHELKKLGSSLRIPAVYYACEEGGRVFIVMEYIVGKTIQKCIDDSRGPTEADEYEARIAWCLSELHRIPVAQWSAPAALDGEWLRHAVYDECTAPRRYDNAEQMERHFNMVSII